MGRRRFTENEILALTKNRLEDKNLTERLQQIREAKSILQDENKKEKRNLIEICKEYRKNTGKSPWSRTEPLRARDGKIDLKDMKKYSKPWAYCPSETTFNVLFQECSYSGRQKTLYLKSQLNLNPSRPNSLKTPTSLRKVIITPRNAQSSVGRFCHLDSLQKESFKNTERQSHDCSYSKKSARPKSSFENSDGHFYDAKYLTRPKSLSSLDKEMIFKSSTRVWDGITENKCSHTNTNDNRNNKNNNNEESTDDNKEEHIKLNVLKSKSECKSQLVGSFVPDNQQCSVLNIDDIDQTQEKQKYGENQTENSAESKDLIADEKVDNTTKVVHSETNSSIETRREQNKLNAETNELSAVPTNPDLEGKIIVKTNIEQNARPKSKLNKKMSSGKKRVSITTNDMNSGGHCTTVKDGFREMSMDDKSVNVKFQEKLGQKNLDNTYLESSYEQVLPNSKEPNSDNIIHSNSQKQTEMLQRSDVNHLDNSLESAIKNQTLGDDKYNSFGDAVLNVSKTNNREKEISRPEQKNQHASNRPTTCPSTLSTMIHNNDKLRQETCSVPNVAETINTVQNVPETSNATAFDEHYIGQDFLSFHEDYEHDERDYIVFRGKKIHDYVKPQDRYKHDPFKMKRREKLFKKLSKDTTLVNDDRNSNLKFNLTFSKASRKRILNQLVKKNSSSVNQVKINAWDETLPNRIQDFFVSIHPFCNNS